MCCLEGYTALAQALKTNRLAIEYSSYWIANFSNKLVRLTKQGQANGVPLVFL